METSSHFNPLVPIARHEMALGLMSIFRAMPDGAKRREVKLEQRFAGTNVRILAVELSAFEQALFFAILEIAGTTGAGQRHIAAGQAGLIPSPPRGMSAKENLARDADAMEIRTTFSELLRHAGYRNTRRAGSETRRAVETGLQRLGAATVVVTQADGRGGFVSLLRARWDAGEGITVILNPRSAQALLALRGYAAIDMTAYRSLTSPTSKILYAWLAAWFAGAQGERVVGLDKLEAHVWGEVAKEKATRSKRRGLLRVAAEQITAHSGMRCTIQNSMMHAQRLTLRTPSG